jgi:hypothetical protein
MDETQKHFVVRYLIARARLRPGRGTPSMTALEQEIALSRGGTSHFCNLAAFRHKIWTGRRALR